MGVTGLSEGNDAGTEGTVGAVALGSGVSWSTAVGTVDASDEGDALGVADVADGPGVTGPSEGNDAGTEGIAGASEGTVEGLKEGDALDVSIGVRDMLGNRVGPVVGLTLKIVGLRDVGSDVGGRVGSSDVGSSDGLDDVGSSDGLDDVGSADVGSSDGLDDVGSSDGATVRLGCAVGIFLGALDIEGLSVGLKLITGTPVGRRVGVLVGSPKA